jgi:hypothetical protein
MIWLPHVIGTCPGYSRMMGVDEEGTPWADAEETLFAELDRRFQAGFDPDATLPADPEEMRPPAGLFLVARLSAARSSWSAST